MPAGNLVKLPQGVDLDAAAACACAGPTSIRAFGYAGGVQRDDLVVVQGTGPVGLFAVAWAARAGCHVIAVGSPSNRTRADLARRLGAHMVMSYREPLEERKRVIDEVAAELRRGNGADVVFDASGSPAAVADALTLVRTRGRCIVPGQYSDSGAVSIPPHLITFKAIRIIGSGQYTLEDVGAYLNFLETHSDLQEVFASFITHRYSVQDADRAYREAAEGVSVKGVFT
jgi:threonine dehydrogenase-like Zn-dependent dehydrogenase